MNNEDIIKYCTISPENVNPAVLRSMLDSIEGSSTPLMVGWTMGSVEEQYLVLDKTWKEIHDAIAAGTLVIFNATKVETVSTDTGAMFITAATEYDGSYYINTGSSEISFNVDSENGYPRYYFS